MAEGQLVFNGIRVDTGGYGLEPMTAGELVQHLQLSSSSEPKDASALPGDRAQTLQALVRLLVEGSYDETKRDEDWETKWVASLAEVLSTELLDESYRQEDQLRRLEDRLRNYTQQKIVDIFTWLLGGGDTQKEKLARLLLEDPDEEPDYGPGLREQLKRDATSARRNVVTGPLAKGRGPELQGDKQAQREWLEQLTDGLLIIPVPALRAIGHMTKRPRKPLEEKLNSLSKQYPHDPWLQKLHQDVHNLPTNISWTGLVETLHDALQKRSDQEKGGVPWEKLIEMLRLWLYGLFGTLGVVPTVDPTELEEAGWGIIYPWEDPEDSPRIPAIKEQLKPLLDLRESQAKKRFKVFEGGQGYRPRDTASEWLLRPPRRATVVDPADPEATGVPYYLLIVGSPEEIPFHFQYQLDVQYAVGRIHFDSLKDYRTYADSVVAVEKKQVPLTRQVSFFAPAHPGDAQTQNSANHLVKPLHERIQQRYGTQEQAGAAPPAGDPWQVEAIPPDEATKERLLQLMGGKKPPALLFAACHGLESSREKKDEEEASRQLQVQGALLCKGWKKPTHGGVPISRDLFVSGQDLIDAEEACLAGTIAFFFACYSAGTPRFDAYTRRDSKDGGTTIADKPFVAALPKAMLSLAKGGALAVVGHVERAMGASFMDDRQRAQIAVFSSAVESLLDGLPVGLAMEYFDGRYAALSTELTYLLKRKEEGYKVSDLALAARWTANNDARGYVIIGDPAVRLPVVGSSSI